jgi:uncharacterized membrane protein YphA (DoxX/SURF4 family)
MPSIFPELFNYPLIAIFVLRLTLGALMAGYGLFKIFKNPERKWKIAGVVELISGFFLIIGFLVQLASIIIFLLMLGALFLKIMRSEGFVEKPYGFYVALLVVSLSLLFLGPGIFALDLPL